MEINGEKGTLNGKTCESIWTSSVNGLHKSYLKSNLFIKI